MKYRSLLVSLTAVLVAVMVCMPMTGIAAVKAKPKPKAAAKPVVPKIVVPSGPKVLTVVAGRPFETVPSSGSPKMFITLCAEESEPGTFTVKYSKPLQNVKVCSAGDLIGSGSKIPSSSITVSKLDGINLISDADSKAVTTDIGSTPTQFWVDVTVPARTRPGVYKGAIGFYSQNKPFDYVPFEVKVLPLRLVGSSKQYILYTNCCPSKMGQDSYCAFLAAFKDNQFKSIATAACHETAPSILNCYRSCGLTGPVPLITYALNSEVPAIEHVQAYQDAKRAAGLNNMFFFTVDNPTDEAQISKSLEQIEAIHSVRAQAAARISCELALQQLEPKLDAINYHVDMPYIQSLINGTAKKTSMKTDWYWWDAQKSVNDNRLYAGVIAWKAGLFGCMPTWMPEEGKESLDGVKSLLTVALREGVDDTRYMTSFMKALRELKDLKRPRDKYYIETTEAYLKTFMSKPLYQLNPTQLAGMRAKLTEYSLALSAKL